MYGHDAESGAGNDGDDSFPFVCMHVRVGVDGRNGWRDDDDATRRRRRFLPVFSHCAVLLLPEGGKSHYGLSELAVEGPRLAPLFHLTENDADLTSGSL